jgi:protease-4
MLPKSSSIRPKSTLSVTLDSSVKESGEAASFFTKAEESFSELVWRIEEAIQDPSIKTIYVDLQNFSLGMGSASELFEILWKARNQGKWIHVSLGSARLKEYLIASAAQSISLSPSGNIELLGPKSERYYLKGVLDKLGIEGEFVTKGAYKSAPETFTQKKASEKSRENTLQNLAEAEEEITKLILRSGKISSKNWDKARKLGVLSAEEALKLELINSIGTPYEEKSKTTHSHAIVETAKLASDSLVLPPKIAVIVASGDIVRERMKLLGVLGGNQITPEKMKQQIDRVQSDPSIKAVVIRVSSGGGDVLASHLIANLIQDLNKTKPVVISMGDVAASGGYFIAAPASFVLANSLSLTGSIGVFSGKPNLSGLYEKIDLNKEIISRSPYPGLLSEAKAWTKEERDIIQRQVDQYYKTFLEFVSKNRNIEIEKVESAAQGRVWLGGRAKEKFLIDDIGGTVQAIERASRLTNLDAFQIKWVYPTGNLLDALSPFGNVKQGDNQLLKELRMGLLSDEPFLYWTSENLN